MADPIYKSIFQLNQKSFSAAEDTLRYINELTAQIFQKYGSEFSEETFRDYQFIIWPLQEEQTTSEIKKVKQKIWLKNAVKIDLQELK